MENTVGEVSLTVGGGDTAISFHSGNVPVLATPRVLALAEQAAVAAVAGSLAAGETTVGIHADLHHVKATRVGSVVTARAELISREGKELRFEFTVTEGGDTVAYGTHRRVAVDRARFLSRPG